MATFDAVSKQYAGKSLVQQKAAGKLIALLKIKNTDSILDVACGPGNLTSELRRMTGGRVAGTDVSAKMIEQAGARYPDIEFKAVAAEDMDYPGEFDVAFCNSALQWFAEPEKAVRAVCRALKPGSRIGVACPGTEEWSPAFVKAIKRVSESPEIKPVFAKWKSPWFFLKSAEEYRQFFEKCGFRTEHISVDYERGEYSVDDAFGIYLSGAANGFTSIGGRFNELVKEEFVREAVNGKFVLDFNRLYYVGEKP